MSNKNQGNAALAAPREERSDGTISRAEFDELKQSFATLALMLIPHALRNYCPCGKIAHGSVQATKPGIFDVSSFYICEDCTLPSGFVEVGRVSLGPAERETVRLANKLGCLRQPAQPSPQP